MVTHARTMPELLAAVPVADADRHDTAEIEVYKDFGETRVAGLGLLNTPPWDWGSR